MKRGKREMPHKRNARGMTAIVAVVLILCCTVGGTLAWLAATSSSVVNTFKPTTVSTEIEESLGGLKEDVKFKNTSESVPVYIRATLVATLVDSEGNVYSKAPVDGKDYRVTLGTSANWVKKGDYYYYKKSVPAGESTDILFDKVEQLDPPEGCHLEVTILSEAIQAVGETKNGTKAVVDAWGLDPEKLS